MNLPVDERQHLLLSLAQKDVANTDLEEKICGIIPEWSKYEGNILPMGSAVLLRSLKGCTAVERSEKICSNNHLMNCMILCLKIKNDIHLIQYSLITLCEAVRENTYRYNIILKSCDNIYIIFDELLCRQNIDKYTIDMGCFILSGCISYGGLKYFKNNEIIDVINSIISLKYSISNIGMLDSFCNILKINDYRKYIFDSKIALDNIFIYFDSKKDNKLLYKSCICLWLISYNNEYHNKLYEYKIINKLYNIFIENRIEKVIRVCLNLFKNLSKNDMYIEEFVSINILNYIQLLENEKWRDNDIYEDIKDSINLLNTKTKQFSNYERYEKILNTGILRWSYIHTEKFWFENVMKFEHDEFQPIKRLVGLLSSRDAETLAVVCHDLGEFARLHPVGKTVLQRLNVKESIMILMTYQDRSVAREALLCVQKMMLHNWKDAATEQKRV
eukprot:GHVL01017216.1.p1 GENE.GHVL01017216.1~~GHVL01017216.1.p1  ORF type:complete len:445 (+),score=110.15 GHVL01017216.1:92-1426(+)